MKRWKKGLVLLLIAAAVLVLVAVWSPNTLRIVLTLPLILFLPGFGLTIILFKRADLGIPERLLISVGLSVSLTALTALVLHWAPLGLAPTTLWAVFLIGLALQSTFIVLFRRRQWADTLRLPSEPIFTSRQLIVLSLAALVTLTAFYIARTPVPQQGFEGYTTLWIKPADQPDLIRMGVQCEEFQATQYQIRFAWEGSLQEGPTFELEPGETWESDLRVPVASSSNKELQILLYRLDRPNEVYRHAVWWLE